MPTSSGEWRDSVCVRYSPFLSHVFLCASTLPSHPSFIPPSPLAIPLCFHLPPSLPTLPSPPSTPLHPPLTSLSHSPLLCPHSINFNQDSSLLCVSSDHGTVHIFASEDPERNRQSRYCNIAWEHLWDPNVSIEVPCVYRNTCSFCQQHNKIVNVRPGLGVAHSNQLAQTLANSYFSNSSIISPSFKFTELHALTLAACSYALLLLAKFQAASHFCSGYDISTKDSNLELCGNR